jgi:hypothetical protein
MTLTDEQREASKKARKQYLKDYNSRPEIKAKKREYQNRPEALAKKKAYVQRPERRKQKREHGLEVHTRLKLDVFLVYSKRHSNSNIPCCRCCGENTSIKFLSVDHIDGRKHLPQEEQKLGGKGMVFWLKRNNYPDGFQILCFNCNMTKGIFGTCPHERK